MAEYKKLFDLYKDYFQQFKEKIPMKDEIKSFKSFKGIFEDAKMIAMQEKTFRTDEDLIYTLVDLSKEHTDRQVSAVTSALNDFIRDQALAEELVDFLNDYGQIGELSEEFVAENYDLVIKMFDAYGQDWDWRSNIDT